MKQKKADNFYLLPNLPYYSFISLFMLVCLHYTLPRILEVPTPTLHSGKMENYSRSCNCEINRKRLHGPRLEPGKRTLEQLR